MIHSTPSLTHVQNRWDKLSLSPSENIEFAMIDFAVTFHRQRAILNNAVVHKRATRCTVHGPITIDNDNPARLSLDTQIQHSKVAKS